MSDNVLKFPELSELDKQFIILDKQRELIKQQKEMIDKINHNRKN
jgi:hypothetical protein